MLIDFSRLRHYRVYKLINKFNSTALTLLDVGAGSKPFEYNLFDITHLDMNSISCFKHSKIKINIINFEPDKKYDVILALEVLEHLDLHNCIKVINKLLKALNPNGILIISMPAIDLPLGYFVNLSWIIRIYTTEKYYLDKELGHKDIRPKTIMYKFRDNLIYHENFLLYDKIIIFKNRSWGLGYPSGNWYTITKTPSMQLHGCVRPRTNITMVISTI